MPFEPWGMVGNMSHRGVEGDDMSQCSLLFVLILAQMAFRGMPAKIFGLEGPRMPIEHQTP